MEYIARNDEGKHNTESGGLSSMVLLLLRRECWGFSWSSPFGPVRIGIAISYWPRLDRKAATQRRVEEGESRQAQLWLNSVKPKISLIWLYVMKKTWGSGTCLFFNNSAQLFIGRVTQLAASSTECFTGPVADEVLPLQEPPRLAWGQRHVAVVTVKLYTSCLSQSVAGAWWRFIVQTHKAPNS